MRSTTSLKTNLDRLQTRKELKQLAAAQFLAQNRLLRLIHPVQLKNTLGRIDANADNVVHGRLPCLRLRPRVESRPHSGAAMPSGAVHPNISPAGSMVSGLATPLRFAAPRN